MCSITDFGYYRFGVRSTSVQILRWFFVNLHLYKLNSSASSNIFKILLEISVQKLNSGIRNEMLRCPWVWFFFLSTLLAISHVVFEFRVSLLHRSPDDLLMLVSAGVYFVCPWALCRFYEKCRLTHWGWSCFSTVKRSGSWLSSACPYI